MERSRLFVRNAGYRLFRVGINHGGYRGRRFKPRIAPRGAGARKTRMKRILNHERHERHEKTEEEDFKQE